MLKKRSYHTDLPYEWKLILSKAGLGMCRGMSRMRYVGRITTLDIIAHNPDDRRSYERAVS